MASKSNSGKKVESLKHGEAKRKNIPTAEYQSVMAEEEKSPIRVAYERRNRDLDPQLVWRGKDEQDWSDLVVSAPPIYIQEKVHPKVIIDDLLRQSQERVEASQDLQFDLFSDFNGIPEDARGTEFYQHDAHWTNRMILGDSLQVMASLAEREGLRGKVQCIYLDPPYGIKFNSNFQWSTTSRDVKDGKADQITREPEQVKAFRDTWRDGSHSYLTYLRDRLTVARDLLADSGAIFVQIGDENVHRVRILLEEIFGETNFIAEIKFRTTSNRTAEFLPSIFDTVLCFAKLKDDCKFRKPFITKEYSDVSEDSYGCVEEEIFSWRRLTQQEKSSPEQTQKIGNLFGLGDLTSSHEYIREIFPYNGKGFHPKKRYWSTSIVGLERLGKGNRLCDVNGTLRYKRIFRDTAVSPLSNIWADTGSGSQTEQRSYVVQTVSKVIQRCILMSTDPGDLVLDPTCGSGTTAYVAEQWGRRWITIDTSRVALALARARIMGARYPYYILADSPEGQKKEAEITRTLPHTTPTYHTLRQGFVYQRVPHITLKSIANNAEIDVIWEQYHPKLQQALDDLNTALQGHKTPYKITTGGREGQTIDFTSSGTTTLPSGETAPKNALLEWEVPREKPADWPTTTQAPLDTFWKTRIDRQKEIDASIAAKADQEYLYDKPYEDKSIVRVAGPFTVESLSPHRVLTVDENDELTDATLQNPRTTEGTDFASVILETLKVAGVQQAHKEDKINFTSITGWPGNYICAEGRYLEAHSDTEKRAGIFIGPEFGTVSRADLVSAAREAGDAGFDVVIACAFNYDAQSAELGKLGRLPILKARMNADLHMANELKNTGTGNLFVIFGEPDIDILDRNDGKIQVKIHGVDIFHP